MQINDGQGDGLRCHKGYYDQIGLYVSIHPYDFMLSQTRYHYDFMLIQTRSERRREVRLACFPPHRPILPNSRLSPSVLETHPFEAISCFRREVEILYQVQHVKGTKDFIAPLE
jgi:hypothetical protein